LNGLLAVLGVPTPPPCVLSIAWSDEILQRINLSEAFPKRNHGLI